METIITISGLSAITTLAFIIIYHTFGLVKDFRKEDKQTKISSGHKERAKV